MQLITLAYYEVRLLAGTSTVLPALLLPAYALIKWMIWQRQAETPGLSELNVAFGLFLPIAAALACAHLMTLEREERVDGLRATYPEPLWRLPLTRMAGAFALTAFLAAAGLLAFRLAFGPFPLLDVLPATLPATLLLLGLSLLASNISGTYWAGAGAAMGYWCAEFITQGRFTKALYLFQPFWPVGDYPQNPLLISLLGIALLLLNSLFTLLYKKA